MKSEHKEEVEIPLGEVIEGFRTASRFYVKELIHEFRSADAKQGCQPFYALCNRIVNFNPGGIQIFGHQTLLLMPNVKYSFVRKKRMH